MGQFNLYRAPPFFFSAVTDPDFSSVVLLIHGDTDTNDYSNSAQTVTLVADAALSGTESKFGSQSIFCDGTGDYIEVLDATDFDFGTGDFTVECWVFRDGAQASNDRIFGAANINAISMYLASGTTPNAFYSSGNIAGSTVLTDGAWVHVALVQESGTTALYQDGTRQGTQADAGTVNATGMWFANTGGAASGQIFTGYFNEIRVTKGVARYSGASYTVPTAPFPNQ